jgi:hypothetical protein
MRFLLQKNIWNEPGYDRLLASIARQSFYEEVELIPFTTEFVQQVQSAPDVIFGSNRFVNVCRDKGFPVFKTFDPGERFYPRRYWLNAAGEYQKLKDLRIDRPVFLKPKTEKFFTGLVVHCQEDLQKIQFASSENEAEEWIWVSDPADIGEEIRFFIIQGKAVTASQYKNRGVAKHQTIPDSHPSWQFVEEVLRHGTVDSAFVMDVCRTPGGWFIVELNNLNSSGLYHCDTDRIVGALEEMPAAKPK